MAGRRSFSTVALVFSDEAGKKFARNKPSQDFVSDAFAHAKFIAWNEGAQPILKAAGIGDAMDDGMMLIGGDNVDEFVKLCRQLRFWKREAATLHGP